MAKTITVTVTDEVYGLLEVLGRGHDEFSEVPVDTIVAELIDHAQQGVYRPGAWEREWVIQVFGDAWTLELEPGDPYGREGCDRIFQRPKLDA